MVTAQGLGPCGEGLRGFESHPPHMRCYECGMPIKSKDELVTTLYLFWVKPFHKECFAKSLMSTKWLFLLHTPINSMWGNIGVMLSFVAGIFLSYFVLNFLGSILQAYLIIAFIILVFNFYPLFIRLYSYFRFEKCLV